MVRKKERDKKEKHDYFLFKRHKWLLFRADRTYQSPEQHKIIYLVIFDSEIVAGPFEMCNLWIVGGGGYRRVIGMLVSDISLDETTHLLWPLFLHSIAQPRGVGLTLKPTPEGC